MSPGNCITANPFSERRLRQTSQTDSRSAYLDLKKGLAESLIAWVIFPCTIDKAKVRLAMESEVIILHLQIHCQNLQIHFVVTHYVCC